MKFLSLKSSVSRYILFSLLIGVSLLIAGAYAATPYWVNDPTLCPAVDPVQYPGVSCAPDNICGDSSGTPQCYDTSTLLPPAGDETGSTTQHSGAYGGGFIINCFATADGGAPYCDNGTAFWCNRDNACYTAEHRQTTCKGSTWSGGGVGVSFDCGSCRAGWDDCDPGADCETQLGVKDWPAGVNNNYKTCADAQCDTNYYACDGDDPAVEGCDTLQGDSCPVGALTGTWQCSVNAGGNCTNGTSLYQCTCVLPIQDFQTGVEADYSSTDPLLWGRQYDPTHTGDLLQFGNDLIADLFTIHNNGSMEINDDFTLATTAGNDITIDAADDLFMADLRMDGSAGDKTVKLSDTDLTWDASLPSTGIVDNINYIAGLGGIIPYGQTIGFEPEYNNTVEYLSGANVGKLELLYDNAANLNYYKWTTVEGSLQEMDIVIRIMLPTGFTGWQATPFNFTYKTEDGVAGNNVIDVEVTDTAGAPVTLAGAASLVNAAAWTTANITFGAGVPTWTAGQPITIKVKLQAKDDGVGVAYASTLNLNYTGK